jgi:hypothetical protein
MKRYQEYMDTVEVSPELHEKLLGLSAPKRTPSWKRYGAIAAALVLVVGIGAFGLSKWNPTGGGTLDTAEIAPDGADIALVQPGDNIAETDDNQTDGGYELTGGGISSFYVLPAIIFNEQTVGVTADYSLAEPGSLSRSVTLDDVKALIDGADMELHLLWGADWTWGGTLWFDTDGTPCAAALRANGDTVSMGIELMVGSVVPDCIVYQDEDYQRTKFQDVEITALKNMGYAVIDGVELGESREVSFYAKDMGCKLTIYGTDADAVEAICARFARWGIAEGFDLASLSAETEP